MTLAEPWMAALFHVARRPAEPPHEEIAEPLLRARQIARGVHRPEDVVTGYLPVEGSDQPLESLFTNQGIDVSVVQGRDR